MNTHSSSIQRSFRLSRRTLELLDAAAAESGESRNALADRLLAEAVRAEHHPLIRFRQGASGRRQPALVGTRLYVHQIMSTVRSSDGNVEEAAEYLGLSPNQVQAAVDYCVDFQSEVEADMAAAERAEDRERGRWERRQNVLA